jgi:hypothetical protein
VKRKRVDNLSYRRRRIARFRPKLAPVGLNYWLTASKRSRKVVTRHCRAEALERGARYSSKYSTVKPEPELKEPHEASSQRTGLHRTLLPTVHTETVSWFAPRISHQNTVT